MKIFFALLCCSYLFADTEEDAKIRSYFLAPEITELPVSDWLNPTFEDYSMIQKHMRANLHRVINTPVAERLFPKDRLDGEHVVQGWIAYRLGRIQLVKLNSPETMPEFRIIYFNNDPEKKDKCVICFTGHGFPDKDWSRGIALMIHKLKRCNFDGHFLYRIGGWPNLAKGRLQFADVPYAFKPFFCEEARDLGYKNILWLDACTFPVKSLDPIFELLRRNGCCFFSYRGELSQERMQERGYVMRSLGFNPRRPYRDISSRVVGFNVAHPNGAKLLNSWIQAAEKKVPFLEPNGDQLSFATLVNEYRLLYCELPAHYWEEAIGNAIRFPEPNSPALFYHHYNLLDPAISLEPFFN